MLGVISNNTCASLKKMIRVTDVMLCTCAIRPNWKM